MNIVPVLEALMSINVDSVPSQSLERDKCWY